MTVTILVDTFIGPQGDSLTRVGNIRLAQKDRANILLVADAPSALTLRDRLCLAHGAPDAVTDLGALGSIDNNGKLAVVSDKIGFSAEGDETCRFH